jgi:hypothetical protein
MKYFTGELIERLGSSDESIVGTAEAEWDRRLEEYERHLRRIEADLPDHIKDFNGLLLHDARVHDIARRDGRLIMVLRKEIPPRDLVVVTYSLVSEPSIDFEGLPARERSPVMAYLYNEFDVERKNQELSYAESILFSNGWELRLCFDDVQVNLAEPIYPVSECGHDKAPLTADSQPAA